MAESHDEASNAEKEYTDAKAFVDQCEEWLRNVKGFYDFRNEVAMRSHLGVIKYENYLSARAIVLEHNRKLQQSRHKSA